MDLVTRESVGFNPKKPTMMMADVNSCFATIEQQANPLLRGKPVVVAAYTTAGGCILTASREAKLLGVKTGMRVGEGKKLCRNLIILPSDPAKYRYVNKKLTKLFSEFTPNVEVKSIDEMILEFDRTPMIEKFSMTDIAMRMKERIKRDVGEWMTVSIGIGPNRYLSKVASGLQKPDGLTEITKENIEIILGRMNLEDLTGIKEGNGGRLRLYGITTPLEFYNASFRDLHAAFRSICGYHWWMRLHGWEIDDREFREKTIGHSHALGVAYRPGDERLNQILSQLVWKMGRRMREDSFTARGLHVSCLFTDYSYWHKGEKYSRAVFADTDFYRIALRILEKAPEKLVRILAVNCYDLEQDLYDQQVLLEEDKKKMSVTAAIDAIHDRWGECVVTSGRLLGMNQKVLDRIAFGSVRSMHRS